MEGNGLRDLVHKLDVRVTTLETWVDTIKPIAEQRGIDVEALKLRDQEVKTTQRLTIAAGGLMGTLLVSLIVVLARI